MVFYGSGMRPIGTAAELERRRHLAVARLRDGYSADAVADLLGVHPRTVYRWQRAAARPNGLAAKPPPGRPRKLTPARERQVLGWFRKSPRSFGFPTDLWTARRVAAVIARKWGVRFHSRYLSAWLAARGVTPQKPQRVPREADPDAIAAWRTQHWPRLQNGRAASGPPLRSSTSAG
jgi:transposase